MVPNKGKALILLRMSNELLRRLSNSQHTKFCGKIRMFLANSFLLCERSGSKKKTMTNSYYFFLTIFFCRCKSSWKF